jgi:glycine cleavage system H protein
VNIPDGVRYTKEHEWVKVDGNIATVGITDYAQGELGDIVFVELPNVGDALKHMQPFGTIEAVKAVSDVYSPLSGKVAAVNSALDEAPMTINRDPYNEGWILKIEMSDRSELDHLLDAAGYRKLLNV